MHEAYSADIATFFLRAMHLQVMAFDANDFKQPVIDVVRQAHSQIFVDRLGDADKHEVWQKAIDQGAHGIQTNLPAELAYYLREHKLANPLKHERSAVLQRAGAGH